MRKRCASRLQLLSEIFPFDYARDCETFWRCCANARRNLLPGLRHYMLDFCIASTQMADTPNVWTQMNYVPPRGQCNHKASLLSSTCPCLRFMLHPLKASLCELVVVYFLTCTGSIIL